jgi:hypothetical protein
MQFDLPPEPNLLIAVISFYSPPSRFVQQSNAAQDTQV